MSKIYNMPELKFDDTKSFDENLELFLAHMEAEDSEMGAVLRSNIDTLKGVPDDSARRRARADFNSKIVSALDEKLKEAEDE